jgi:hypothetical protein
MGRSPVARDVTRPNNVVVLADIAAPPMTLGNMREEAEMTRREAIEKCARATVKRQGYREDQWRQYPTHVEFAENIVVVLEALGLLKSSS